jgi:hypothetical protein
MHKYPGCEQSLSFGWSRRILVAFLLSGVTEALFGQTAPSLAKTPDITDKTVSGIGQAKTAEFDSIVLFVCSSRTEPVQPLDCAAETDSKSRRVKLVNLGTGPFPINDPDGKFSITLAASFPPGVYVWLDQVTVPSQGEKARTSMTSNPVRVPVPLLRKASLSVSGYDSASRDVGATATLDLDRGHIAEGLGETRFLMSGTYDDKWKHAQLSSNVTQTFAGNLSQYRQFRKTTYVVPYARAYHNNTQGVRVEQLYGIGIAQPVKLPHGYNVELDAGAQAMLENIYAPGSSANLFGLRLSSQLDHVFSNKMELGLTLAYTPVFTRSRSWTATGDVSLDIPVSSRWSIHLATTDNYYEIAPKTFNKNYLQPSIGIAFK